MRKGVLMYREVTGTGQKGLATVNKYIYPNSHAFSNPQSQNPKIIVQQGSDCERNTNERGASLLATTDEPCQGL
jgi:hypothetical protein